MPEKKPHNPAASSLPHNSLGENVPKMEPIKPTEGSPRSPLLNDLQVQGQAPAQSAALGRASDFYDETDSRSLLNLLPKWFRDRVLGMMTLDRDIFNMDEPTLKRHLLKSNASVNETDNMMRVRFWLEYDRVQAEHDTQIDIKRIYPGIVSRRAFDIICANIYKTSWLLCPPVDYMVQLDEALSFGLMRMREILGESPVRHGKVDAQLAKLQFAIWKNIDDRKNGAAVQKIEQRSVHMNHHLVTRATEEITSDKLHDRLKILNKLEREALHLPNPNAVDVTPVREKIPMEIDDDE